MLRIGQLLLIVYYITVAGGPAVLTFEAIHSGYRTTGFHFSRLF